MIHIKFGVITIFWDHKFGSIDSHEFSLHPTRSTLTSCRRFLTSKCCNTKSLKSSLAMPVKVWTKDLAHWKNVNGIGHTLVDDAQTSDANARLPNETHWRCQVVAKRCSLVYVSFVAWYGFALKKQVEFQYQLFSLTFGSSSWVSCWISVTRRCANVGEHMAVFRELKCLALFPKCANASTYLFT